MKVFQKLSLTGSPLNPNQTSRLMQEKDQFNQQNSNKPLSNHVYITDDIKTILSPVLLDQFSAVGVTPAAVVNFSERSSHYSTPLHADLTYYKGTWQPMEFGINWELAPGVTEFSWFDGTGQIPTMPIDAPDAYTWPRSILNGTRFVDNQKLRKLKSLVFEHNTAYLVRTDIPHQVISQTPGNFRECISIRFLVDDVPTWDKALEIFKPLFA